MDPFQVELRRKLSKLRHQAFLNGLMVGLALGSILFLIYNSR